MPDEMITLQELIDRCVNHAMTLEENSYTQLLLFNAVRAITEVSTRLDEAESKLKTKESNLIFMPSRGDS